MSSPSSSVPVQRATGCAGSYRKETSRQGVAAVSRPPCIEPKAQRKRTFGLETEATFGNQVQLSGPPAVLPHSRTKLRSRIGDIVRHSVGKSCPALSAELGLILLTAQVVRGSVGLRNVMVGDRLELDACDLELVCTLYLVSRILYLRLSKFQVRGLDRVKRRTKWFLRESHFSALRLGGKNGFARKLKWSASRCLPGIPLWRRW